MQKTNNTQKKIKDFSKCNLKRNIEKHLLKAEEDIRNGMVVDAREVFREWRQKYEL